MGQKAQGDMATPSVGYYRHATVHSCMLWPAGHQNFQSRSVVVELHVIHIIYVIYGSNTDLGDQYAGTQSLKAPNRIFRFEISHG